MPLYITTKEGKAIEWHVGDPMPIITFPVCSLQADGDELRLLTDAMKASRTRIGYDPARVVRSIATMLGWTNIPPQHILEQEIAALKSRSKFLSKLLSELRDLCDPHS